MKRYQLVTQDADGKPTLTLYFSEDLDDNAWTDIVAETIANAIEDAVKAFGGDVMGEVAIKEMHK